jgi:hypothetical protein
LQGRKALGKEQFASQIDCFAKPLFEKENGRI